MPHHSTALPRRLAGAAAALFLASTLGFAQTRVALPLDDFADAIQHWRNKNDTTGYPRLAPDDLEGIAANLLLYQRANGGWRENDDPLRILSAEERAQVAAERGQTDTSLDNFATCPQVRYLAAAYRITGNTGYREAALRGLDFVFAAQHSSGAWPHSYPNTKHYRGLVTFADAVTPNVLHLLRQVAAGTEMFDWTEPALRERARAAVARGDAAILRLQVRQKGKPTGWAGQYDPVTLAPTTGRTFELPSIASLETVDVLRYLTSIEDPSPEVVAAVEAAARWLEDSALHGVRLVRTPIEPVRFQYHTATEDVRLVEDPAAPPLWTRFYDLETNLPVLSNRGGQRVATFDEISLERRSGYNWYGTWPAEFLAKDLPAWRARVAQH